MLSLDRKKEGERVRTRNESRLNHLYLSTIIWSGDETCLIVSTDIPASCFDIMFRCLVSAEPGPITCSTDDNVFS